MNVSDFYGYPKNIGEQNKMFIFEQEQIINQPVSKIFSFFEKPENLSKLTPNWLRFNIKTKLPLGMKQGAEFEYTITIFGISMKWKTLISKYSPPNFFIDEQVKGPYKRWVHTHSFKEINGNVIIGDRVEYDLYGGFLKYIINIFVGLSVNKIFNYRKISIEKEFSDKNITE